MNTHTNTAQSRLDEVRREACLLGKVLHENKGSSTVVLDLKGLCTFADFFVITTASSFGQLKGLLRILEESAADAGISLRGLRRSLPDDEAWVIISNDEIVIHVMLQSAREFYDLERLWFECPSVPFV